MTNPALPCIVCTKPLENATKFDNNQPGDGVCCQTHGNYGSRVYDPIGNRDEEYLEFNVCDDCLVQASVAGRINLVTVTRDVRHTPVKWVTQ